MTDQLSAIKHARTALRRAMRTKLAALTTSQRAAASASITSQLLAHPLYQAARVIMLFASPTSCAQGTLVEPDLSVLAQHALQQGKTILAPRVDWPSRTMHAALVQRWPADLVASTFTPTSLSNPTRPDGSTPPPITLLEPPFDAPIYDPAAIHLVLVPGLAFDHQGNRLGRGGGFYDRFLPAVHPQRTMGVAFACQVTPEPLPVLSHDVKLASLILGD